MDIAPTLLELCGIEWPKAAGAMDGISFSSLLTDSAAEDSWSFRPAFSETESPGSPRSGMSGPLRSWRTQEWKWIETDQWSAKAGRGWLYNISGDPNEALNLSAKLSLKRDQMRRDLRGTGWLEEIVHLHSGRKMDEDTRLELATLGYLDEVDQPSGTMASKAVSWHDCLDF
jgi:arylsulfatase A-like enzyme